MAAFAGGFDDFADDESPSQPLPPEDRLWRHPSELGAFGVSLPLDPITVRRRWLASQPSRASAWTAGLVGALLATGLVALGTHLATAFTTKAALPGSHASRSTLTSSPELPASSPLASIGVGSQLAADIASAGGAIVYMDVSHGLGVLRCLAVGVRADGLLLVPAAEVRGATSILVTLADGSSLVGKVLGSDASGRAASSGLALVQVNGVSHLPVAHLDDSSPTASSVLAVAVTSPGASSFSVGTATSTDGTTVAGGTILVDAIATDMSAAAAPVGSLLIGADGRVAGIVTGAVAGRALATPAWLAARVADEIARSGSVVHGWLGIGGTTATSPSGGVVVTTVSAQSAASVAGVRTGDTIVSIAGHPVETMSDLQARMYFLTPGSHIAIGLMRAGRQMMLDAVLSGHQTAG